MDFLSHLPSPTPSLMWSCYENPISPKKTIANSVYIFTKHSTKGKKKKKELKEYNRTKETRVRQEILFKLNYLSTIYNLYNVRINTF